MGDARGLRGGAGTCSTIWAKDSGGTCTSANGKYCVLERNVAVLWRVP